MLTSTRNLWTLAGQWTTRSRMASASSGFCLFLGLPRSSGTSRSRSTSAPASLRTFATALAAARWGRMRPGPRLQSSK